MKTYVAWMTVKAAEKVKELLPTHKEHLEKLKVKNRLVLSGPFLIPEYSGGIMIFKAESFEEAKDVMENDPFIRNEVEDYDLRELAMTTHTKKDFVSYH